MVTFLRVLVFAVVAWLSLQLLVSGTRMGGNPLGKTPIAKPAFLLAKLALTVSIFLLVVSAVFTPPQLSIVASAACMLLLIGGTLIFTLGMGRLGGSLRMGLPLEETVLVTSGIYSLTRNPVYVGIFLLMGASLVFAFSWLNLAAAVIGVVLHHRIILAEERFLALQFKQYEDYRNRVNRYWGRRAARNLAKG
jgi:protein-S-isoprenylcysteine O-methyltransferase Ste14